MNPKKKFYLFFVPSWLADFRRIAHMRMIRVKIIHAYTEIYYTAYSSIIANPIPLSLRKMEILRARWANWANEPLNTS